MELNWKLKTVCLNNPWGQNITKEMITYVSLEEKENIYQYIINYE